MEDFQDAAKRHLDDAELLFLQEPKRLANASHLFGISAECSLKTIVRQLNPNGKFYGSKGHIPALFAELSNIAPAFSGNPALMGAIADLRAHFANWNMSQRYDVQTIFATSTVSSEYDGAKAAHLLMNNFLSGLI